MANENNGTMATRLVWWIVGTLAALLMFGIGFTANAVASNFHEIVVRHQADMDKQEVINRDREARIARLEALVPEMKTQLNRIESKIDAHMVQH